MTIDLVWYDMEMMIVVWKHKNNENRSRKKRLYL